MYADIDNIANYLIFTGLAILAIEIVVMGFSTFILTFFGLAMLFTGVLVTTETIAPQLMPIAASVAVFSALLAALLWRPLKMLQNRTELKPVSSDLVGHRFKLESVVTPDAPTSVKYSGITWKVVSETPIAAGTLVETVEVDVGQWRVQPVAASDDK